MAPVLPPIADPRILLGGLSQAAIRVAEAVNNTAKIDFAVVQGFRSGFGVIFRQAFDVTCYEQLWEETFIYKRVLPITYIAHLETRHVILDTVVVKRLKANYYRGWGVEEHINSFGVRLNREQRKLSQYVPPIIIPNADKCQHYLEQMWTRTDIFDQEFMTAWTKQTIAQKTFDLARAYFQAKVQAIADFKAAGGQVNSYATANAATEIKDAVASALAEFAKSNADSKKENAMAASEVSDVKEQLDTLQSAVALLAKAMSQRGAVSPKRSRKGRRRYVAEDSSDEESSSSEEEETPPPKPKKVKRKKKATHRAASRQLTFKIDGPYKPKMKWELSWSKGMKAAYQSARRDFHETGTEEAIKDKIAGIKGMTRKGKAKDASEGRIANLTAALEKWEAKLTE